jgi:putative transposase
MRWLTMTRTRRWHAYHRTAGTCHLDQGRFKSFPVQSDDHFLTVCRYVERNALRAGLIERAEERRRGSFRARRAKDAPDQQVLSSWPIDCPRDWSSRVNRLFGPKQEEAVRRSIQRGQPFGAAP